MTNNDILAEYVRENYPKIEKSFDFACYRFVKRIGNIASSLAKKGVKIDEENTEDFTMYDPTDSDGGTFAYSTGEDAGTIHNEDGGSEREAGSEECNDSTSTAKQEAEYHSAW